MSLSSEILADSPVWFLDLQETSGTNANDQGSANQDGTYTNGVTLSGASVVPAEGSDVAASFDGSDDYVRTAGSFSIGFSSSTLTMEAAFVATSVSSRQGIIALSDSDVSGVPWMEVGNSSGAISIAVSGNFVCQTVNGVITAGAKHHVAYKRTGTGSGTHHVFVNGFEVGLSTNGSTNFSDTADNKLVGSRAVSGSTQRFAGRISHAAVYASALSDARILAHAVAWGAAPLAGTGNLELQGSGDLTFEALDGTGYVEMVGSGDLSLPSPLVSWDAEESQQTALDIVGLGTLTVRATPVPVPDAIRNTSAPIFWKRYSQVWPTPTDSGNGKPDPAVFVPTSTTTGIAGRAQIIVFNHEGEPRDVTFFGDVPTQLGSMRHSEPFGHESLDLFFPQITTLGETARDHAWTKRGRRVEVHILDENDDIVFEDWFVGNVNNVRRYHGTSDSGLYVSCIGVLRVAGLVAWQPPFRVASRDIGEVIAHKFNDTRHRPWGWCDPVTTGINTRKRGSRDDTLLGYTADLLSTSTTSDGLGQWTVSCPHSRPVIELKDTDTVNWTVTNGQHGLESDLNGPLENRVNVIYGQGIADDGCFPAGTLVEAAKIEQGYRYWYSGHLVTIRTASGHELTGTPNHPVLTSRGWVAIDALRVGDGVFSRSQGQRAGLGVGDVEDAPVPIEQVVGALAESGVIERVPGRVVNLHGDAADSEVEVVRPDHVLLNHTEASSTQDVAEPILADPDDTTVPLTRVRTDGVSTLGESASLLRRELTDPRGRGFGEVPNRMPGVSDAAGDDVVFDAERPGNRGTRLTSRVSTDDLLNGQVDVPGCTESAADSGALLVGGSGVSTTLALTSSAEYPPLSQAESDGFGMDVQAATDLLGGLPGEVAADNVVHIERAPWSGHVHNLQTGSGAYVANGILVRNCQWANIKYPNFHPDDSADYPWADPDTVMTVGTVDADTDSGTGVTDWQTRMDELGYAVTATGTFSAKDSNQAEIIQSDKGLTVDGIVGPQTWAATFNVGSNVGDLDGAFYGHLAARFDALPILHEGNGALAEPNPNDDPVVPPVEMFIDFGEGVSKDEGIEAARAFLHRIWTADYSGTLTLTADPEEGHRRFIRAGQNIMLKQWEPGSDLEDFRPDGDDLLLHISGVTVDPGGTVTLDVDTQFRDMLNLAEIHQRNRDNNPHPGKRTGNRRRLSEAVRQTPIWDCESKAGHLPRVAVYGGLWSVFKIPAGTSTDIVEASFSTSGPASEFAVAVFGQKIEPADLVTLVGNPLDGNRKWDHNHPTLRADHDIRWAWGSKDEPGGYYPDHKLDENGDATGSLTGDLVDDGGFNFRSSWSPWAWVAVFAADSCFVSGLLKAAPVDS